MALRILTDLPGSSAALGHPRQLGWCVPQVRSGCVFYPL